MLDVGDGDGEDNEVCGLASGDGLTISCVSCP